MSLQPPQKKQEFSFFPISSSSTTAAQSETAATNVPQWEPIDEYEFDELHYKLMVSDVVAVKRIAEFMETNAAFVHHPQITHILAELIILFVKVSAAAADDAATATDTADKECILKIVCGMCEQNRHCADAAIKHPIVTTAQRDAFVDALVVVAENAHFQYSPAIQTKAKNLLFLLATICVSMR